MVLDSQTQTISLIRQDQRGTQLFLAPDLGVEAVLRSEQPPELQIDFKGSIYIVTVIARHIEVGRT